MVQAAEYIGRKGKVSIQQDVRFPSGSLYLAGTLALPNGEGPWPAVLLIAGSGQVDKNENTKRYAIDVLLDKIKRSTKNAYRAQLAKINAKWMREFLAYDPAQDLSNIHVPVLAITGSKDIQVMPADLERMGELVPGEFEGHEISNVTHMLRAEPEQPSVSNYKAQILQPVDSRVLSLIDTWLAAHLPDRVPVS